MVPQPEQDFQVGQSLSERFESGELFVPFEELTWIDFLGSDRGAVLGNLTTNHVRQLEPGQGLETFITEARGKAFAHGTVYALPDRLRMVTVPDQFDRLSAHIDRYVIREDLQIVDASQSHYAVFWPGVAGSQWAQRWQLSPAAAPQLVQQTIQIGEVTAEAYQVPWTRSGDWLFVVPKDQADALDAALIAEDVLPGSPAIVHCGRIRHRFPWFGMDCSEANLPQEMDRDALAIDFKKGCYLGQETIARLDAMGQVQKKLTLWEFDSAQVPTPGMELRAGDKVVATVTSGTFCFDHGAPLALCTARRSHFSPGATADSPIGSATVINSED